MGGIYAFRGIRPVVHPRAFVHPDAVLIGDVWIGEDVYIGPGASLRGDMGRLVVEAGANVQDNCVMHGFPGTDCVVEEEGHIGHGAVLHGCRIRRGALVGMNSVVMDGAVVGEEAFVGAMSFLKAGFAVPARTPAAGVPAQVLRPLGEEELAWKRQGTREYRELAREARASLVRCEPLREADPGRPRLASATGVRPLVEMRREKER